MHYQNIREEELKNKIAHDYFHHFDCTKIIGNIDFCVTLNVNLPKVSNLRKVEENIETESLLWAEAKRGKSDVIKSIVQLILTIGKARTFDKNLPPAFLGAFDSEKIAFIPYNEIHDIFYVNDFNWNVTPSNHETKEFQTVFGKVKSIIENNSLMFDFGNDDKEIKEFIKINFVLGKSDASKVKIDKNNFLVIYNKWLVSVKPSISVNWDIAKKIGIIDGDFYLADLLSHENESLKDKLFVFLRKNQYELDRKIDEMGMFSSRTTTFNDNQKAHTQFWNKYERPPKEEYWDYIVERRDLLVPQDVRERKGSFFTPQIWVELSQKYLTDVLGEDWQDEYYIWDCAAGTGNLLTGLTNKYNIWASTLDTQDVEVMKDRIKNGANLLEDHVFQFDFLNDDFNKLPKPLYEIINNPEKRKKLVIYINPPYAEASNRDTVSGRGENKSSVATETKVYDEFHNIIGTAAREVFTQFIFRIYTKIPNSKLAQFSKLKMIQAPNFDKFRNYYKAEFKKGFVVPANTFDNVKGQFPIGFFIWDFEKKNTIVQIECDLYDKHGNVIGIKRIYTYQKDNYIINWLRKFYDKNSERIAYLRMVGTDMQNNVGVFFTNQPSENDLHKKLTTNITKNNVIQMCIYLTMRHVIEQNWLNDREHFLYPNNGWESDSIFQNNCLTFALFTSQNQISSKGGTNHWLPFTEQEVNSREKFDSNFMTDFIKGKKDLNLPKVSNLRKVDNGDMFDSSDDSKSSDEFKKRTTPLVFSPEATAVFDAGRELWRYYHSCINQQSNSSIKVGSVNASLYDIREYFQGRNPAGKMNNKSDDTKYMELIGDLRDKLKLLAKKIEPKVYECGFLKG